jgi:hypothetical protein
MADAGTLLSDFRDATSSSQGAFDALARLRNLEPSTQEGRHWLETNALRRIAPEKHPGLELMSKLRSELDAIRQARASTGRQRGPDVPLGLAGKAIVLVLRALIPWETSDLTEEDARALALRRGYHLHLLGQGLSKLAQDVAPAERARRIRSIARKLEDLEVKAEELRLPRPQCRYGQSNCDKMRGVASACLRELSELGGPATIFPVPQ